jgi:CRP-like cAMP-binding protein
MISPEEFRRYRFFAGAPGQVLNALAESSSFQRFKAGERLFDEWGVATHLMIVKSGQVNIVYHLGDDREVAAESAISGDMIAWSALLPPNKFTASAVGTQDGELIKLEGSRLREICDADPSLGYQLMLEVAKGLRDRLTGLRVQLAAAR